MELHWGPGTIQSLLHVEPQPKLMPSPWFFANHALTNHSDNALRNKPQREGNRKNIIWHKIRFLIIRYRQEIPAGAEKAGDLMPWQVTGTQFGCLLKNLKNIHYLLFNNLIPCKFLPKKDHIWMYDDIHHSVTYNSEKNLDILHIQE